MSLFSLPIEKFTFSIGLTCSVVVVASVVGSVGASVVSSTVYDSDAEVSETDGSSDFSLQPVNDTPVVSINADTTAAIIKRLLFFLFFIFLSFLNADSFTYFYNGFKPVVCII